ncbi:MAG TPA: hypothetical protein VLF15_05720, partial [Pseudoxanthomonas sp.]|nr:hypothetical protein [Pseudoxanthomonas sp.]
MISLIRSGQNKLPVELAVLMAPMAGVTWEEAARVAMLAGAKDDKRAAQLERVFFCKTLAGVVGMLLACVMALGPDGAMAGTKLPKVVNDPHILETLRALAAWTRRRLQQAVRVAGLTGDCTAKPSTKLAMLANTRG